ncbi:hypothetical protein [Macrococcus equipercicus]|nr:hypothetical protein [Macrococcus equipercicus]
MTLTVAEAEERVIRLVRAMDQDFGIENVTAEDVYRNLNKVSEGREV